MTFKDYPLITIITVVYNSVKTLEETIVSVLGQSYPNIEYIIIDGASRDGSVDLIKKYQDSLSYWCSEPDLGIYDAMNKGLKLAKGELVGILNSDDWYENNTVERVVDFYRNNPTSDVIHGLLRFINGASIPDSIVGHHSICLSKNMIEHPTCFVRKKLYEKIGHFDTNYKSAADYDWMLRARSTGSMFTLIPFVLANFRRGGMSDSYIGALEDISIKRKYKLISFYKYVFWRTYISLLILYKKVHII